MKIEELDFSVRTYNCLKRAKVDTVDQLSRMSDKDLMRIRCFGQKCLDEVRAKIPLHRKTNADWIRAMSDKELVEFIGHNSLCDRIQGEGTWCEEHAVCEICLAKWLQQPAEPSDSPDEDDRDSGLVEE